MSDKPKKAKMKVKIKGTPEQVAGAAKKLAFGWNKKES